MGRAAASLDSVGASPFRPFAPALTGGSILLNTCFDRPRSWINRSLDSAFAPVVAFHLTIGGTSSGEAADVGRRVGPAESASPVNVKLRSRLAS